jgi:DNA-binding PadR family transcriptional regulator
MVYYTFQKYYQCTIKGKHIVQEHRKKILTYYDKQIKIFQFKILRDVKVIFFNNKNMYV